MPLLVFLVRFSSWISTSIFLILFLILEVVSPSFKLNVFTILLSIYLHYDSFYVHKLKMKTPSPTFDSLDLFSIVILFGLFFFDSFYHFYINLENCKFKFCG